MSVPLGVILAGGRATRMGGGDKGLRQVGFRSMQKAPLAARTPPPCFIPASTSATERRDGPSCANVRWTGCNSFVK